MKAFDFDSQIIGRYSNFSRSFTKIRSADLTEAIEAEYDANRFWPDSLLSLNPRYKGGPTISELVESGDLDDATGKIFRFDPSSTLRLHRHQAQSLAKAKAGQSYVVTTGTGSGKSLCFFVPIVDTIVRALKSGEPAPTASTATNSATSSTPPTSKAPTTPPKPSASSRKRKSANTANTAQGASSSPPGTGWTQTGLFLPLD